MTELTTRIDEVSATLTYIGKAAVGAHEAHAVWQIKNKRYLTLNEYIAFGGEI